MKKFFIMMLAAIGLASCTTSKPKADEMPSPKALVLYYSQTGTTEAVAQEIQQQLGADIEALQLELPYDGDFGQTIARCQQEMAEGTVPAIKPISVNPADYDLIFLGYPVWFGTYAMPVSGLVNAQDFEGKKVVTFCTFGSGGLQSSTEALRAALPKAEVIEGYGVRTVRKAAIPAEVNRFLIEQGYKEGEVEALPAFMEHHPVTEAEGEVFTQACSDYQFPLGTPVDVAVRETATSTDYEFTAQNQNPDGQVSSLTIYVTVGKDEGAKPEFTQVVR